MAYFQGALFERFDSTTLFIRDLRFTSDIYELTMVALFLWEATFSSQDPMFVVSLQLSTCKTG